MAKSDARFGYQADLGRDVHDLSAPFVFTCAPGQLLPIFEDLATPGDAYYVNHDLTFLRTQPLLAPAMVDVKVHLESFFVPAFLIYESFGATIFNIQDIYSSMYTGGAAPLQQNFPKMVFEDIHDLCEGDWKHTKRRHDIVRLMDLFEMNPYSYIGESGDDAEYPSYFHWNPSVFPWQWLSYHCVYQYYYRLDDKEQFEPAMFNFDQFRTMSEINMGLIINDFWQVHQRPWDFDYFTSMYRSPIVSDVNVNQILQAGGYSDLLSKNVSQRPITDVGYTSEDNSTTVAFAATAPSSYGASAVQAGLNTASIRQLFANEKLAMVTGRARKTYDSQVIAHFGAKVPHDVKHDISMIGHDEYDLKIGEVTSLSASDTASLGTLAGKGWSQGQGKQHKFVAPCHGVIMTIFSVEPKKRYYGGYNRINSVTSAFDIPIPEYDRLGNQPMFRYETGEVSGSGTVTATDVVGWKERYYANKRRHARCTLAFMNPNGVHNAGYNEWASYAISSAPFGAYTSTNNHTARPDLMSRFYIDTHAMDGMMVSPYLDAWQNGIAGEETSENWNASPWLSYQRDPFIVDMDLKVKKVSWMSKDGEPIYNF